MSRILEDWIVEITGWQDKTFPQATPLSAAIHLTREALEVQASAKAGQLDELASELADVFLLTVGVAHLSGIDLEEAVARKMAINRNRVWGEPDSDGVVEHVREETPTHEYTIRQFKGKTLIQVFEDEGLIPPYFDGMEDILIKTSAEDGGKIFNSPNNID